MLVGGILFFVGAVFLWGLIVLTEETDRLREESRWPPNSGGRADTDSHRNAHIIAHDDTDL